MRLLSVLISKIFKIIGIFVLENTKWISYIKQPQNGKNYY